MLNSRPSWSYCYCRRKLQRKFMFLWYKHEWQVPIVVDFEEIVCQHPRCSIIWVIFKCQLLKLFFSCAHDQILVDWQIWAKRIAETWKISRELVGFIIYEQLAMLKKWVPQSLNSAERWYWVNIYLTPL